MSASRRKGTAFETVVVDYLRQRGWPHAERRALAGAADKGDIAGLPLVCIEVKNAKTITLAAWADETAAEKANAAADIGALWVKRRGKAGAAAGYIVLSADDFTALLKAAGY